MNKLYWQRWLRIVVVLCFVGPAFSTAPMGKAASQNMPPVLAYYYIWYHPRAWDRAKIDFPILGRYTSDDKGIMREHIRMAKQAGITGFIVSWKSTQILNNRLRRLIEVATEEQFKLAIIYQGLDFNRRPQPADQIDADLANFVDMFAESEVFDLFERPLVIWSGTWEYSADDVMRITDRYRDNLLILSSEKNIKGYERVADYVDGNAYYWSSVDPETYPGYQAKLTEMGKIVQEGGGIWIAPAAPGFDARLIGGTRVVDRKDGETLRQQMAAAAASSPDAIGLISWNEFSENSHVEPSVNYGTRYLEVLAEIHGKGFQTGIAADQGDFDSSEPGTTQTRIGNLLLLAGFLILVLGSFGIVVLRSVPKQHIVKK